MSDGSAAPEKAYRKGCMWGMSGGDRRACPYEQEELKTQWLAGWRTGFAAWRKHRTDTLISSGSQAAAGNRLNGC